MYTRSLVRIFPEIFLLLNAATWNKVMVPARKAHFA